MKSKTGDILFNFGLFLWSINADTLREYVTGCNLLERSQTVFSLLVQYSTFSSSRSILCLFLQRAKKDHKLIHLVKRTYSV